MSLGSMKNDAEGWIGFGIGMLRDCMCCVDELLCSGVCGEGGQKESKVGARGSSRQSKFIE